MEKIAMLVSLSRQEGIFAEKYYEKIQNWGELRLYDQADFSDTEHVKEFLRDADIVVTSWESPLLSEEYLDMCPNLKLLIHAAGSVKSVVDKDAFVSRGIRVTNSAVALGEGVAETALGFALSACKGFFTLSKSTRNGEWNEKRKTVVKDFYDITIGVISGGFVGRHFIELLHSFNVDILLYDPFLSEDQVRALGAKKADLNELLSQSDVISIHAPKVPATEKMLNETNLPLIKDGAVLINTARGSIIDEQALIRELKKNRFFACIDVTEPEPPALDNELRNLENVVLTPHIAGACTNGLKRIAKHVCEELERFEKGEPLRTEVNLNKWDKIG